MGKDEIYSPKRVAATSTHPIIAPVLTFNLSFENNQILKLSGNYNQFPNQNMRYNNLLNRILKGCRSRIGQCMFHESKMLTTIVKY